MPARNSTFLASADADTRIVGNFAILPLKTKFRGPAYPSQEDYDIVDEVLDLFRVNTFFRNFEIKGGADRALVYGILFISDCLNKLKLTTTKSEAAKALNTLAIDHFAVPGEPGFPLNSMYQAPRDRVEFDLLRGYLSQFRQELASRLIERIYEGGDRPNKFWLAFTRRRFMNLSL
jgi:actin related protein 2/3 complex subunit 3